MFIFFQASWAVLPFLASLEPKRKTFCKKNKLLKITKSSLNFSTPILINYYKIKKLSIKSCSSKYKITPSYMSIVVTLKCYSQTPNILISILNNLRKLSNDHRLVVSSSDAPSLDYCIWDEYKGIRNKFETSITLSTVFFSEKRHLPWSSVKLYMLF